MSGVEVKPHFGHGMSAFRTAQPPALDGLPGANRLDRHQDLELNLVEGGSFVYLFGAQPVEVRDGELTVFWGAQPHQQLKRGEVEFLSCIHIPLSWVLQWELPGGLMRAILDGVILSEPDPRRHGLDSELMKQWVADVQSGRAERCQIALLEIQARLRRLGEAVAGRDGGGQTPAERGQTDQDKALRMARFIAEHYTAAVRVSDVARTVGLHPDYAMTVFKRTYGFTMTQFINQHRVWHAQRMLATTGEQVLGVALQSGFGSLSQFNTVFKQLCGRTPREFRKSLG
ncbi:MAG: helix-turn-helix domain-containing protein [Kiritimatiellae bacterium]|nr:helix-turn-helix domain-containing protein [Kiritimatiellia bacterium]